MAAPASESACVVCGGLATRALDPPRRTLARGLDPNDTSYSVTVILPDVALCEEHASEVDQGSRLIGWCDDQQCRTYGEIGELSRCGEPFKKLSPGNRN
jgi:hypothetical protein